MLTLLAINASVIAAGIEMFVVTPLKKSYERARARARRVKKKAAGTATDETINNKTTTNEAVRQPRSMPPDSTGTTDAGHSCGSCKTVGEKKEEAREMEEAREADKKRQLRVVQLKATRDDADSVPYREKLDVRRGLRKHARPRPGRIFRCILQR